MSKSIIITTSKFAEVISLDEIVLLKADGSYSEVFLSSNKKIIVSKNLHWFENKISDVSFFRIHKSYLVNVTYIYRIFQNENEVHLKNGMKVPISRRRKPAFWRVLEDS